MYIFLSLISGHTRVWRFFILRLILRLDQKLSRNEKLLIFRLWNFSPELLKLWKFLKLWTKKFLWSSESFLGFPDLKEGTVSWNTRKAFFWENIRKFLILELESSISWNIRIFFWVGFFFVFLSSVLKVAHVALNTATDVLTMSWRHLARLLEDVFETSLMTKSCYAEGVFKTSWRNVLKSFC